MYDEYVALNQDTLDRIEIVPMTVHLVVRNNNRLLVTMYTDVEQFLLYQTKNSSNESFQNSTHNHSIELINGIQSIQTSLSNNILARQMTFVCLSCS